MLEKPGRLACLRSELECGFFLGGFRVKYYFLPPPLFFWLDRKLRVETWFQEKAHVKVCLSRRNKEKGKRNKGGEG
jgi:hypothetical protein